MAGRPRKATALKILNGSAKHDPGRINKNEPKLEPTELSCPSWMPPEGKKEWKRVMPVLVHKMKILTVADFGALVNYCLSYAKIVIYTREISSTGFMVEKEDQHGNVSREPNPLLARLEKEQALFKASCAPLGLSPGDRSRVSALEGSEEVDPMAALLNDSRRA